MDKKKKPVVRNAYTRKSGAKFKKIAHAKKKGMTAAAVATHINSSCVGGGGGGGEDGVVGGSGGRSLT